MQTFANMCKKRSIIIPFGTLLIVLIVLACVISSTDFKVLGALILNKQLDKLPCLSKTCIQISNDILQSMDTSVDPCDDFYAYACNGWEKSNPIPEGKSMFDNVDKLNTINQEVIKQALEKPIETFVSKAEQKVKIYYESCLDVNEAIEELGALPMLKLLKDLGGWNITESGFDIKNWSVQKTLQIIQNQYNIQGLFNYNVDADTRNSSINVISISQDGLSLPSRDYYLNKTEYGDILELYLESMTKIGVLLGGEQKMTREQMAAVVEFESKLANITIPQELKWNLDADALYIPLSVAELQDKAPFIDWRQFFEDGFRNVNKSITSEEKVLVSDLDYLINLALLISEYNETQDGQIIINNYLVWQTVGKYAVHLSKDFRDILNRLTRAIAGISGCELPRWRQCIDEAINKIGIAVGAIFVREAFKGDSKIQAEAMINNIRQAFKENFKNLEWMDEETREASRIKVDAISNIIGYTDFLKNPKQLDESYTTLIIDENTYFQNNINLKKYTQRDELKEINNPVNKTIWTDSPAIVDAYYSPQRNQITIPAGILQSPLYDPKYPASLNYGGTGFTMAHELTHGFDNQGREFDKDGNLNQWWNNNTIEKFKNRTKCFAEQYSKFQINGKNVKGYQTLGENIADNGGLKAAYHAYLEYAKDKPEPPQLPGINFTQKQLFFIAYAQFSCSAITKKSAILQIEIDSHAPAKFRIIGPLINFKEFSDEFNCKLGSRMNPISTNRCEVW